jgi:hypothetical protein
MRGAAQRGISISGAGARASALLLSALLAAVPAAHADEPALRLLIHPLTQWGWARDSAAEPARSALLRTRRAELDYFRALGFTHVSYGMEPDFYDRMRMVDGKWEYVRAAGDTGPDSSLASARREAEKRGMRLVPQLAVLSHQDVIITWRDSSISEFPGRKPFLEYCAAHGLPPDPGLNHVAALGDNPVADAFFLAQLDWIRRGWAAGPGPHAPDYIHLGHDELGFDSVCFVKAGRNARNPKTRSELVAEEIARRVAQVRRVLGDSVVPIVYGDSFLPTDLGERYGLSGEAGSGKGGVLWILHYRYGLEKKILIMPWNYILEDGDTHYWSRCKYDKEKQLALLEKLGFAFVPGPGEHGSNGDPKQNRLAPPFSLGLRDKTLGCTLQWIAAARKHPALLRGYAYQIFEPYDFCAPDGLCAGFGAPLLAYAGWTYPGGAPSGGELLPPKQKLDKVDYRRSRREGMWIPGVHFPKP